MDDAQRLEDLFQTLGDANRLRIIRIIGDQNRSVSELVRMSGLSQPLVSHHLRVLREHGILKTKREGPFIYYELFDVRILDALGIFSGLLPETGARSRTRQTMFSCREEWMKFFSR